MKMRNKTLDIAKGIAMISIILGHLSVWRINCVVFTYHIPIFYLITGYFLFGAEKTSFRRFAGKKARTLLVPYYVACLLIIMFSIPLNMYLGEDVKTQVIRWIKAALYAAGDSYTFSVTCGKAAIALSRRSSTRALRLSVLNLAWAATPMRSSKSTSACRWARRLMACSPMRRATIVQPSCWGRLPRRA